MGWVSWSSCEGPKVEDLSSSSFRPVNNSSQVPSYAFLWGISIKDWVICWLSITSKHTFSPIPHHLGSRFGHTGFLESTQTSLSGSLQQLSSGCKYKHTHHFLTGSTESRLTNAWKKCKKNSIVSISSHFYKF